MNQPFPIQVPLLNPNEPESLLAFLSVREGQHVSVGESLCTLETTKSTAEVTAEAEGYIVGLRVEVGQRVAAGEILCYLADLPDWTPPQPSLAADGEDTAALPKGLRITQPALTLAARSKLDLSRLPIGPLVTASMVQEMIAEVSGQAAFPLPQSDFGPTAVIVYGGGGHGKMLIELIHALKIYRIVGLVDDGLSTSQTVLGLPVLGGGTVLPELYRQGVRLAANAVGGVGNIAIRIKVFQKIAQAGFVCPTLVHPTAYVEPSASLSAGAQVFALAYIGSQARIGFGNIIGTGAIVSHDCALGEYVNLSPGAILAGEVQVGDGVLVGMGATVNLQVKIGAGARIGNNATVKADVPQNGIVRAGGIWPT